MRIRSNLKILSLTLCLSLLTAFTAYFTLLTGAEGQDVNTALYLEYYSDGEISDISMAYRLYVPEDVDYDKEYALLLFFHGAGERGEDGNHLLYLEQYRYIQNIIDDPALRSEFIIVAPQCPEGMRWVESDWQPGTYDFAQTPQSVPSQLTFSLLDNEIFSQFKIDKSRIYITGLSMGGFGVWDSLARYPDMFAGAVTVCGGCDIATAEVVKDIPVWSFHAEDDTTVLIGGEKEMHDKLKELGAVDTHFTVYNGCGHAAWNDGYADEEAFKWLLSKQKALPEPEENAELSTLPDDNSENDSANSVKIPYIILGVGIVAALAIIMIFINIKLKRRHSK